MSAPAIFLDRDGTLVHARHYPTRPEELVLFDGVAPLLAELKRAGFRLVLITNQSGLARGYFTEAQLAAMHAHLQAELQPVGAGLDAIEYCPHHPEGEVEPWAVECDCRKPKPGMLLRAAERLGLDLWRSWFLGDILDDVEAGNRAGCRTILVDLGTEATPSSDLRTPAFVARDTVHALRIVRALSGRCEAADLTYRPPRWDDAALPQPAAVEGGARHAVR